MVVKRILKIRVMILKEGVNDMTKGEYCKLKGLHTSFPNFNPNDKLDQEFKNAIDTLVGNFDDIYNESEDCGGGDEYEVD